MILIGEGAKIVRRLDPSGSVLWGIDQGVRLRLDGLRLLVEEALGRHLHAMAQVGGHDVSEGFEAGVVLVVVVEAVRDVEVRAVKQLGQRRTTQVLGHTRGEEAGVVGVGAQGLQWWHVRVGQRRRGLLGGRGRIGGVLWRGLLQVLGKGVVGALAGPQLALGPAGEKTAAVAVIVRHARPPSSRRACACAWAPARNGRARRPRPPDTAPAAEVRYRRSRHPLGRPRRHRSSP